MSFLESGHLRAVAGGNESKTSNCAFATWQSRQLPSIGLPFGPGEFFHGYEGYPRNVDQDRRGRGHTRAPANMVTVE
jgi:hypothetical protein